MLGYKSIIVMRAHFSRKLLAMSNQETIIPYGEYPSCLHTTLASLLSQKSSQMVPQVPLTHTSTLPSLSELLIPLMRTDPSKQIPVGI